MAEATAAADADLPPCRNCGAPAPGAYCPSCGQETRTRVPTFIAFMREAGGRYVALDGRLWKTLGALLFRPGFLTREYFAGRRRRYIRPARLFLVASLVMFAALRIAVGLGDVNVLRLDGPDFVAAGKEARAERGNSLDPAFDVNVGGIEFPTIKKRLQRFNQLSSEEKEAQITDGVFRYGPYAMILLLPAFALLLKLLYLGRGRRYPLRPRLYAEHIVFAAHNHAFVFLAIIAATVISVELLRGAVIVWMLVYLLWSQRVVYRGSWMGIAARSFVMLFFYSIMFALVTAGLVALAVLLR
jgi:hypothetical protein